MINRLLLATLVFAFGAIADRAPPDSGDDKDPRDNPTAAWRRVEVPAVLASGVTKVFAGHDGYVYVGGPGGVFRALVAEVAADPADTSVWRDLSATWPKSGGAPLDVSYFAEGPHGEILAAAGIDMNQVFCDTCLVARLNSSTLTWSVSNHFRPGYEVRGIDFDGTGAIWAVAQQRGVFKSTNGGASFSLVVTDPYASFGQTTGFVYGMSIINGRLYWGGEGALNSTSLDFKTDAVETGGVGYGLNHYHVASNGTEVSPATEIIAVGRQSASGSVVQRWTGGVWSDVVFEPTLYWRVHAIVKGAGAHEYYYAGHHGESGGVAGTTDGVSWFLIDKRLPPGEQQNANWLTISPQTNTLFLTFDVGSAYAGELWIY